MKRTFFLFLLGALLWSGCSNTLEVMVSGNSDMNSGGNAAVVHIYQLSGEGNFTNTPLSSFWRDDEAALGGELVTTPQRITLYPNETKTIEFELAETTTFIGVAADLRNPDREQWRAIYSVDDVGDRVTVTVQNDRISVQAEGGGGLPLVGARLP